jgi:hypothetical protein
MDIMTGCRHLDEYRHVRPVAANELHPDWVLHAPQA